MLGGITGILRVAILVHEHSLGAYMSCTMTLEITSDSESAIFYDKIHYFDGYFAHFWGAKFGALFEIRVVVGHP